MDSSIDRLLSEFDRGAMSRRELLRALGLAAVAMPAMSWAQAGDGTAARGRGNRAPGDTTHVPAPFEPTGWTTVWLDHISYQCQDYKKAAAFYAAVMGWTLRGDDGSKAVMDAGDVGGVIMTNGFVPPPPPDRKSTSATSSGACCRRRHPSP